MPIGIIRVGNARSAAFWFVVVTVGRRYCGWPARFADDSCGNESIKDTLFSPSQISLGAMFRTVFCGHTSEEWSV